MSETKAEAITMADWAPKCPPIFPRCVSGRLYRYDMSRPYIVDGMLYASDARIAVRMSTPPGWDVPNPEAFYPKIGSVFDKGGVWMEVAVPEVAEPCGWCHGTGRSTKVKCECPVCENDIVLPDRPCDQCEGLLIDQEGEPIAVIPGYWIQRRYAAILRQSGVASLMIPESLSHLVPASFALGEIDGRLMPMMPPKSEEAR